MEIRPRLNYIGAFGLQASIKFAGLVVEMGLLRRFTVTVDDPRGARSWRLTYKVLPATLDGPVVLVGDEGLGPAGTPLSRADYVWGFFCARWMGVVKSFLLTCPRDGKTYLVQFADMELSYEKFATQLYSSGVLIVQVSEPDVQTLDDGSLGDATENPDRI